MDDNEKILQVHNIYVKWAKAHGHDPENKKVFDAFINSILFTVHKFGWKKYDLELDKHKELYVFDSNDHEEKAQLWIDIQ